MEEMLRKVAAQMLAAEKEQAKWLDAVYPAYMAKAAQMYPGAKPEELEAPFHAVMSEMEIPAPMTLQEVLDAEVEPMTWPMPGVLPHPALTAISGKPGSYKTFFSLWMALRMSGGKPCFEGAEGILGAKPAAGASPVLFIEEENSLPLMQNRLRPLALGAKGGSPLFYVDRGCKVRDPRWRSVIMDVCARSGVRVVFMDPFSSVMGMEDENSNAEASEIMDVIRKTFIKNGISVVFIHHPSKGSEGETLRGAGDILGKVDMHILLQRDETDKKVIRVSFEKVRCADMTQFAAFRMGLNGDDLDPNGMRFTYMGEAKSKEAEAEDEIVGRMRKAVSSGDGASRKEIAEAMGMKTDSGTFKRAWGKLVDNGTVVKDGKDTWKLR